MDVIAGLQELGFTEYEAKVYQALVRHPGTTGYEVGRHSGVPRARVYEVLEGLVRRGAALVQVADGKQVYHPLEHRVLLANHRDRLDGLMQGLASRLDRLAGGGTEPGILVIRGPEAVRSRCRHLCREAGARLFVSGWPEDLVALAPEFRAAVDRGVVVWALSYGEVELPVQRLFRHDVSPLQYVQVAAWGRWLAVVTDQDECLVGQMAGPERTVGLWTAVPAMVFALGAWIQHDICLHLIVEEAGAGAALSPATQRLMREMWNWERPPAAEAGAVDMAPLFEDIRRRLELDPALARAIGGCFEFRLEPGGVYHVDLRGGSVDAGPGPAADPGLVVTMSAADLMALAAGTLPPGAVYHRGRIGVKGDIELAARLQILLGG